MNPAIDLNADLGEGAGEDELVMRHVSSCAIACGGHAGDDDTMRETLRLARAHGVAAGAHPAYPDREGFGRRRMTMSAQALGDAIRGQIEALARIAARLGIGIDHIKPHGALYHEAARDRAIADLLVKAFRGVVGAGRVVGPPAGALRDAARDEGLAYIAEGFADRQYNADGSLRPRGEPGAIILDDDARIRQALALARGEPLALAKGGTLRLQVESLCVHGDSPGAGGAAERLREALEANGFTVRAAP